LSVPFCLVVVVFVGWLPSVGFSDSYPSLSAANLFLFRSSTPWQMRLDFRFAQFFLVGESRSVGIPAVAIAPLKLRKKQATPTALKI